MDSPAAQSKYIKDGHYAAVSDFIGDPLYQGGKGCGNCYRLTKSNGENPLVVQVVDQMVRTDRTFDGQLVAFQPITGDTTDVYDIKYEQVDCETDADSGVYTVYPDVQIDDNTHRLWWTAIIFHNLRTGVEEASVLVGNSDPSQAMPMQRNGARWETMGFGAINGALRPIKFRLTLNDGTVMTVDASNDPAYHNVDFVSDPTPAPPMPTPAPGVCAPEWEQCPSAEFPNKPPCCAGLVCTIVNPHWASCQSA